MSRPIVHIFWPEDSPGIFVAKSGETLKINIAVQSSTEPIISWFNEGVKLDKLRGFKSEKTANGRYFASLPHVSEHWKSVDLLVENRDGSKLVNIPIKVFKSTIFSSTISMN